MAYDDVEAELLRHPAVRECVVTLVPTGPRANTLVAYVVTTGTVDGARIREFLARPRLLAHQIPRAVIPVGSLPRTSSGEVDRERLPLPPWAGQYASGKGVPPPHSAGQAIVFAVPIATIVVALLAYWFTHIIWPGSTDLSMVSISGYRTLFTILYMVECLSFGLGISFLFFGYGRLARLGRPRGLTTLAFLSIFWLLAAWWPQDNFYRLAAKTDWGRQAALVYSFNVTLMLAAAVVVVFVARERALD